MLPSSTTSLARTAFKPTMLKTPRVVMGGRGLGMRSASTAIPPTIHRGPRPNHVLMGVLVGGALLGTCAYEYYWKPHTLEHHTSGVAHTTHAPRTITFQELQKHDTRESCWLLINGHVYDATSVLRWHPAGAEIILQKSGGQEATEAFLAAHKPQLLSHLPRSAHLGRLDRRTLWTSLREELTDEEMILRTAEAVWMS